MTSGLEIVGGRIVLQVDRVGPAVGELGDKDARESRSGLVENGWVLYCLNIFSWLGK